MPLVGLACVLAAACADQIETPPSAVPETSAPRRVSPPVNDVAVASPVEPTVDVAPALESHADVPIEAMPNAPSRPQFTRAARARYERCLRYAERTGRRIICHLEGSNPDTF